MDARAFPSSMDRLHVVPRVGRWGMAETETGLGVGKRSGREWEGKRELIYVE